MKLAILSRAPRAYARSACAPQRSTADTRCEVLNTLRFAIDLSGREPDLQFRGQAAVGLRRDRCRASAARSPTSAPPSCASSSRWTSTRPTPRTASPTRRDKLRATQILSRHDIGMPATTFVRNRADVMPAIERVGGAPVVIKLLEGTQGIGVILAPDIKVAEAIIETLHSTQQNVLIQQLRHREQGPRHPRPGRRRPRGRGDAAGRAGRRVPVQRPPRRHRRAGRADAGVRAGRGPVGPDHGPPRRRRRHARGQRRPARDGGQLLARARGHRDRDPSRRRRSDHRPHRQPGRLPRDRRAPAPHGVHRVRRRRARSSTPAPTSSARRSATPASTSATSGADPAPRHRA